MDSESNIEEGPVKNRGRLELKTETRGDEMQGEEEKTVTAMAMQSGTHCHLVF